MVELLKQRITVVRNVKKVGVNIHRLCMMWLLSLYSYYWYEYINEKGEAEQWQDMW
jgi:hypothetical protein